MRAHVYAENAFALTQRRHGKVSLIVSGKCGSGSGHRIVAHDLVSSAKVHEVSASSSMNKKFFPVGQKKAAA